MRPSAIVYAVTRAVYVLETPDYWPPLIQLCRYTGESWEDVRRAVETAAGKRWDEDHQGNGHPWIDYVRRTHTAHTTEDGRRALDAARFRPHLYVEGWRAWIDQARWPSVERTSDERVAIPTGGSMRGGGRLPDAAALMEVGRMLGVSGEVAAGMILDGKVKLCPRCLHDRTDRFVHPIGDFGRREDGTPKSWCRRCLAEVERERRRTK